MQADILPATLTLDTGFLVAGILILALGLLVLSKFFVFLRYVGLLISFRSAETVLGYYLQDYLLLQIPSATLQGFTFQAVNYWSFPLLWWLIGGVILVIASLLWIPALQNS